MDLESNDYANYNAVEKSNDDANYNAAAIRAEFKQYQELLPSTAQLLQERPSVPALRTVLEQHSVRLPVFLKPPEKGGIQPHQALCSVLLSDYQNALKSKHQQQQDGGFYANFIHMLSLGAWYPQWHHPVFVIRDQFYRVADSISTNFAVPPHELRTSIRNHNSTIPNYFLDPENPRQFPPHIALLVILQNTKYLASVWYRFSFGLFALSALLLRIVLEVIGGAGAIWGGAEVVQLRNDQTEFLWRWISIAVGVLCLGRFFTLHAPRIEDEGDLLGPAGPWSLRWPVRLRAVCDHPFHYFVRAVPPGLRTKQE